MRNLLFQNPELKPGLNLTVRNGTKWADALGETVAIRPSFIDGNCQAEAQGDEGLVARARIIGVLTFDGGPNTSLEAGNALFDAVLPHEHDPACRTLDGLMDVLDEVYPDGWGPTMTMLFFEIES